eukprot:15454346-Alexandrium_andersonii.AAC.1
MSECARSARGTSSRLTSLKKPGIGSSSASPSPKASRALPSPWTRVLTTLRNFNKLVLPRRGTSFTTRMSSRAGQSWSEFVG